MSAVPVFELSGAYTILLILQRRPASIPDGKIVAHIAHVTDAVGAALQACLDGLTIKTQSYQVYAVGQQLFHGRKWVLVSPEELQWNARLSNHPRLSEFGRVTQGFVTGADDVFIVLKRQVPEGEAAVYIDYLPDRVINRYKLPSRSDQVVFYPFENGEELDQRALAKKFPKTWAYLLAHKSRLQTRKSVVAGTVPWWRPERPREPARLLRPKIVAPHLMLTPRFAVDSKGRFAVSHSPYIIARDAGEELVTLRLLCAVLNSSVCNWHFRTYAPKYRQGYSRLEVAVLKDVPVPDLHAVSSMQLAAIVTAVERLERTSITSLDDETDEKIAELYGFTPVEIRVLKGV